MELRHLQSFAAIAEAGSISAAAAELHITQPALSRQLAELERSLGVRLCLRNPRGVALTDAGRTLNRLTAGVLSELDRFPEMVRAADEAAQTIRIGMPPGAPHEWFRSATEDLGTDSPLRFSLFEASSDEQMVLLGEEKLDLALVHADPRSSNALEVLRQPLGAVLPPGSRLWGRRAISLQDLDGRIVMAHAVGEIRAQEHRLRVAAEAVGVRTHWVFRKFAQHSVLIAELAGADAALTTEPSARINFPGWKWIPLRPSAGAPDDLAIHTWATWRPDAPPEVRDFARLLISRDLGTRARPNQGPQDG